MIVEYALPKVWSWVSSQSEWINVLFASYSSPLLQVYKTKKLWFVPLWKKFQIFMEDTLLLSLIFKTNFSKMIIFLENYKISFCSWRSSEPKYLSYVCMFVSRWAILGSPVIHKVRTIFQSSYLFAGIYSSNQLQSNYEY